MEHRPPQSLGFLPGISGTLTGTLIPTVLTLGVGVSRPLHDPAKLSLGSIFAVRHDVMMLLSTVTTCTGICALEHMVH